MHRGPAAFAFAAAAAVLSSACATVASNVVADSSRVARVAGELAAPTWKLPLEPAFIENMRLVAPGKLLVAARDYTYELANLDLLLVDTASGAVLWRHPRQEGEWSLLDASADSLLYRVDQDSDVLLVCLDAHSGATSWGMELENDVQVMPLGGAVVAVWSAGGESTAAGFDRASGAMLWKRPVGGEAVRTYPIERDVLLAGTGLERIVPRTGEPVWRRDDVQVVAAGPAVWPRPEGLLLADRQNRLLELDPASGATRWTSSGAAQIEVTDARIEGDRVFVRGVAAGASQLRDPSTAQNYLLALARTTGKLLWRYLPSAPVTTNFLVSGQRLYVGTPTSLVCLSLASGEQVFSAHATSLHRPFPAGVRRYGDVVVYIGELVIAGFDARTGARRWRWGVTPLTQEASLAGIDNQIQRLEARLGRPRQAATSVSDLWFAQSSSMQARANALDDMARQYRLDAKYHGSGYLYRAESASLQADINRSFSQAAANIGIIMTGWELGRQLQAAMQQLADRGTLTRFKLLQRAVLDGDAAADLGDYVFRPADVDSMAGILVVHLPTGKGARIALSPMYEDYGMWNVVDPVAGVIYYHGVGLDPAAWTLGEPFMNFRTARVRMCGGGIIAQPITLPR